MNKEVISTTDAPAAIGPYAQAIKTGLVVFLSGQVGLDPATGQLAGDDLATQARQAFANLAASEGGATGPAIVPPPPPSPPTIVHCTSTGNTMDCY